jgi:hypothetical protein
MSVSLNDPVNNFGPTPHLEVKARRKIWTYLSVVALVAALGLSLNQVGRKQNLQTSASGGVVLSMIKNKTDLRAGDVFTVDILLDAREAQITNADVYLIFPEDVLQATGVVPATFFPELVEPFAIGPGTALVRLQSPETQTGGGVLTSLTFKVLKPGNASIQFSNETTVTDKTQKGQVANLVDKAIGLKFEVK